jgi:hypothetical protein
LIAKYLGSVLGLALLLAAGSGHAATCDNERPFLDLFRQEVLNNKRILDCSEHPGLVRCDVIDADPTTGSWSLRYQADIAPCGQSTDLASLAGYDSIRYDASPTADGTYGGWVIWVSSVNPPNVAEWDIIDWWMEWALENDVSADELHYALFVTSPSLGEKLRAVEHLQNFETSVQSTPILGAR